MAVEWTEHRFAGGALALDVANTVVLRHDPKRKFDRFADSAELSRFADAACRYRAEELKGKALTVGDASSATPRVIAVREAIDRLFRHGASTGEVRVGDLPDLLLACADCLKHPTTSSQGIELETAVALSALSLLPEVHRIRICLNCHWLFVDRSRNRSRRWCDMAVCGNRQKAMRHYRRRHVGMEEM